MATNNIETGDTEINYNFTPSFCLPQILGFSSQDRGFYAGRSAASILCNIKGARWALS